MEKIYSFWEVMMIQNIMRFYHHKYLSAIRHTFYVTMPFWLTVSFFDILGNLFLNPSGILFSKDGLNLGFWLTGLNGEEYLQSRFVTFLESYRQIIFAGYSMTAIIFTITLAGRLAKIWNSDKYLTIFCAITAFILFSPVASLEQKEARDYFSELGFFSAFFITALSARIFSWLYSVKKLRLKTPESFPKEMSHYLSAVFPVLLTVLIFSLWAFVAMLLKLNALQILSENTTPEFFQNIFFVLGYQFFVWLLWWLGIPGYSITSAIQEFAYLPAQLGNKIGESSAIFTTGFFEAGVIHVLGLIIAILVFSQHEDWRAVSKFSLPLMFFNIQEIFVFGLPVVLNPLFLIPYIIAPLANTVVGWIVISWGIVPIFQIDLPWTMPLFISGIAATHSIMGGILQLVWLVMDVFIYAPFVITANTLKLTTEKGGEKS